MLGKQIRLQRIVNPASKRTVIVPLDHGLTVGPVAGLTDIRHTVARIAEGGADCVVMHKGAATEAGPSLGRGLPFMLHLSGGTSLSPLANTKTLVATVEDALRLGADAVSVHVNLGNEAEARMLDDLGRVTSQAAQWGVPVMAMIYARGPVIKDEYDPEVVALCARVGMELGADIVKVPYTGNVDSFAAVTAGCSIPVVIAGGPKCDSTAAFLKMVHDSIQAGGAGLSVGRNIFQHSHLVELVGVLRDLVHHGLSLRDAQKIMRDCEARSAKTGVKCAA